MSTATKPMPLEPGVIHRIPTAGGGRRRARWWLVVAGVILGIVILRVTLFRPRPIVVEAVTVARGLVEDAVTNSQAGTVRSRQRAHVGAERAGRVAAIPAREGTHVKKGDALLLLDDSTARTQLEVAQRDLEAARAATEAARAEATLARQQHERNTALFESKLLAQGEMDLSKSKLESAEAGLGGAEAQERRAASGLRLAQGELDHLRVLAPFDGVVSQRMVEVGESVVPGQPVLEVVSLDRLYVSAPLDEIDIGRVREGLPARVTLDPYRGRVWQGVVTRVSPVVNDIREQNRTLEVEVEMKPDPEAPEPKPGTSADVEIILAQRDGVLRVPTQAVIEGKRVLVIENGKAAERAVKTGLRNWDWTEITDGVREGALVITSLEKQGVKAGARVAATSGGTKHGTEAARPSKP
jgi:HlyD family secretion protein